MPPPCGAGWWGRRHRGHQSLTAGGGHSRLCIAVPGLRRAVCKPISRKVPRSSRAEPEAAEATRSHVLPPARFLSSANLHGCSHQACMTLWGPANSGNTERAENCRKGTLARLPAGSPCLPRSAGWDRLWRMARREFHMTGKESRLERGLRAEGRGLGREAGAERRSPSRLTWRSIPAQEPGGGPHGVTWLWAPCPLGPCEGQASARGPRSPRGARGSAWHVTRVTLTTPKYFT